MDIYNKLNSKLMNNNSKFILNGRTFKDIFNLASGINEIFSSSADCNEVICVCTEDKSIIASALLASLGGGPEIALPYSLSDRVISDMKEELRFTKILTDNSTEIPSGMEAILPENIILSDSKVTLSRDPDSVFLKLFTGGTTGKPRVWSKTPRNILSEAEYLSQKFNITNDDLFAATVSPLHIYGLLFSVVIPFISSARIINDILSFPKEITSAIEDLSATILVSVPMHFRTLKMSSFHRNRLRLAFSSAGALDEEDAAHFLDQTGLGITEIYGSTETGGIASMSRAQDEKAWNPFEVVDFRIVKDRLHVRSDFISPDLPLNPDQFFITEDRAVYYDQRSFLLLGRADDIVKVAGKRVDLGEVQNKIKDINGVKNAYVLSLPVKKGRGNEIAALIAADVDEAYIRRSISQILESYAVPRRIRVVNEIPETSTGKYDYKSIKMKFFSK